MTRAQLVALGACIIRASYVATDKFADDNNCAKQALKLIEEVEKVVDFDCEQKHVGPLI